MKVLLILNHAPDYRESFLEGLAKSAEIELTVVAQPCRPDRLSPPTARNGYKYIEIMPFKFFGLLWQPGLRSILRTTNWDVVCVSANLRHISRIFLHLSSHQFWKKWIWWGLIFAESDLKVNNLVRRYLFKRSAGCLVHGKSVLARLHDEFDVKALSYNNTEVQESEFRNGNFEKIPNKIKILFVGTYKPRKKIERLIELAYRRRDVWVRIIGPGMEQLVISEDFINNERVSIYNKITGDELNSHFDWADIVASPGNVGLLTMTAARHGKGIVIDKDSYHGPEVFMAEEAQQPIISFGNNKDVDEFLDCLHDNPSLLQLWGSTLQELAKREYTIENMVKVHVSAFSRVSSGEDICV